MKIGIFILSLWVSFFSFAQNTIGPQEKIIESLIFQKINTVRDSLGLNKLVNDEILVNAAILHSKYQGKIGKLTHYESKDKLRSPKNRVLHFGGTHRLVLENVASQDYDYAKGKVDNIADSFVTGWIKSPGHYKNLINPKGTLTGVGVVFDSKAKKYYATQVFGSLNEHIKANIENPENAFGIRNPEENYQKKCEKCIQQFKNMPKEVHFGVYAFDQEIYFYLNDINYLSDFFGSPSDGLAVDVISRPQFPCGKKNMVSGVWPATGKLIPPTYFNKIKEIAIVEESGVVWVKLGDVPKSMLTHELEFNLLFIRNKNLCRYQTFNDVSAHMWGLLEMGMYKPEFDKSEGEEIHQVMMSKNMSFVVPFKQGKYTYTEEDIKPIFDSLKIEKYDILEANIEAYASVEGSEEINHELLEKRAESILSIMKNFQTKEMVSTVKTSENWVEFLNDIQGTKFKYLGNLSRTEVKSKLQNKTVAVEIEPILSKHRKAILSLKLQLKDEFTLKDEAQAIKIFNSYIEEKNLEEAYLVQLQIYDAIKNDALPPSLVDKLEVPVEAEYVNLLSMRNAFKFESGQDSLLGTLMKFLDLDELVPNNKEIKYNIAVLRIKGWASNELSMLPEKLKKDILGLKSYGVSQGLIDRLLMNFHIVLTHYAAVQRDYKLKDQTIQYIYNVYRSGTWTDIELYNMAGYFSNYSRYDLAVKIIEKRAAALDVEENLVFYYLNLTIADDKYVRKESYRRVMLNAIDKNNDKFCKLFAKYGEGGVTFQLLRNKYLKKMYCEHCN